MFDSSTVIGRTDRRICLDTYADVTLQLHHERPAGCCVGNCSSGEFVHTYAWLMSDREDTLVTYVPYITVRLLRVKMRRWRGSPVVHVLSTALQHSPNQRHGKGSERSKRGRLFTNQTSQVVLTSANISYLRTSRESIVQKSSAWSRDHGPIHSILTLRFELLVRQRPLQRYRRSPTLLCHHSRQSTTLRSLRASSAANTIA